MNDRVKRLSQNNNGVTLVELIVTIAIFAIVAIAIGSFFAVMLFNYKRNSSEVSIQMESQMAEKRLEDLILTTTNSISNANVVVGGESRSAITLYNYNGGAAGLEDGRKQKIVVYYNSDKKQLIYQEYTYSGDKWVEKGEEQIFAGLIDSFSSTIYNAAGEEVNLTDNPAQKPVKIELRMSYSSDDRSNSLSNTVAIRNSIIASDNTRLIY